MRQLIQSQRTGALSILIALPLFFLPAMANAGFYLMEEVRPMMVKADADRDGYLSRPEVCAEDPALLPGFEKADINRDGKLDLGEFEILLISL